ncbi:MAG: 3-hydroxyacyl-CoA dehydrogenase family protein [Rhodospirillales bacterium]
MGEKTNQETLAKAIDYVLRIKKTQIVVNDSRGFYTSRCFGTFVQEGLEMLVEGIAPAIIDNVGRATGMPRGPLEMNDDVALDLSYKVREQTRKDLGDAYRAGPVDALIAKMVTELGRLGRKNGRGFYDYAADGTKKLWHGLADLVPVKDGRSGCGADRGNPHAAAVPPGGGSGAVHGGERRDQSARGGRRRHPGLGVCALDRRADQPDRGRRRGAVR